MECKGRMECSRFVRIPHSGRDFCLRVEPHPHDSSTSIKDGGSTVSLDSSTRRRHASTTISRAALRPPTAISLSLCPAPPDPDNEIHPQTHPQADSLQCCLKSTNTRSLTYRRLSPQRTHDAPANRCASDQERHDGHIRPGNCETNALHSPATGQMPGDIAQTPRHPRLLGCTSRIRHKGSAKRDKTGKRALRSQQRTP